MPALPAARLTGMRQMALCCCHCCRPLLRTGEPPGELVTVRVFWGGHLIVGPSAAAWRAQALKYDAMPRVTLRGPLCATLHMVLAPNTMVWASLPASGAGVELKHLLKVARPTKVVVIGVLG